MKWLQYGSIGLGFVLIIMAITNPSKDAYVEYATLKMADEVKEGICDKNKKELKNVIGTAADLFSGICRTGIDTQRSMIRDFIINGSRHRNYIILTVYRTDVFDRRYTTVGICGNFLTSTSSISNSK